MGHRSRHRRSRREKLRLSLGPRCLERRRLCLRLLLRAAAAVLACCGYGFRRDIKQRASEEAAELGASRSSRASASRAAAAEC